MTGLVRSKQKCCDSFEAFYNRMEQQKSRKQLTRLELCTRLAWILVRSVNLTTHQRQIWKNCLFSDTLDALGIEPVIDYLRIFHLPSYPTFIDSETGKNSSSFDYDWIESIADIKRIVSADIIIGFDIFPDPTNRQRNRIVLGTPETTSVLPL